ncbi:MAG TPA: acyl carrier protein [Gemmataceae bacterium]|nr:acyl carrier protein [Gemmataceae bacterium]
MDNFRDRLSSCFSTVFPDLSAEEIPLASMASVGKWDSLATITLLTVIEEEFDLQIPPDDLEQFASFDLILDYLEGRCAHVS